MCEHASDVRVLPYKNRGPSLTRAPNTCTLNVGTSARADVPGEHQMKNAAKSRADIVWGLPFFGALVALAAVGCGADASSDPSTDQTQTEELRHGHHFGPKLCRTADGSECDHDELCLPLLSRACPGPKHICLCVPKADRCPNLT